MLKVKFQKYLKDKGYSEFTPKGLPSTVYNYPLRIDYIIYIEHLSNWEDVVKNIDVLIKDYDIGGKKEKFGKKSHSAVINALKRFYEFICENNLRL